MSTIRRINRLRNAANSRQEGIVVLQDIHDPHNAAACIRTCEALGFYKVYFIFENEKIFNPKKIGKASSSSANKWLEFKIFHSTKDCLRSLKKQGYKIYAAILDKSAKTLYKINLKDKKIAWLFGNEHRGLSGEAVAFADQKIYLPMAGLIQSLNLSVTAAICLYETARQRQKMGQKKFLLPAADRKTILKSYLRAC